MQLKARGSWARAECCLVWPLLRGEGFCSWLEPVADFLTTDWHVWDFFTAALGKKHNDEHVSDFYHMLVCGKPACGRCSHCYPWGETLCSSKQEVAGRVGLPLSHREDVPLHWIQNWSIAELWEDSYAIPTRNEPPCSPKLPHRHLSACFSAKFPSSERYVDSGYITGWIGRGKGPDVTVGLLFDHVCSIGTNRKTSYLSDWSFIMFLPEFCALHFFIDTACVFFLCDSLCAEIHGCQVFSVWY